MSESHIHESHPAIVKRLKRAGGHLAKVVAMIEAGEPCLAIATQLQAVEAAITQAKRTLIQDHLDHCLDHVVGEVTPERRQPIDDFKAIAKFL